MVDPKGVEDVYFTAHAFSSTFACTLMFGGFCRSTVYLGSWGRHLFLIKTISSFNKTWHKVSLGEHGEKDSSLCK
jgi:hypothetical protein